MIQYNAGYWGVGLIWQMKGSVFPKAMVWSVPLTVLAGVLHWLIHVKLKNDVFVRDFGIGDAAATVFQGFNFVLGFLIVFRSQQAYARWWEGGTLLQQLRGEWFNAFSCLVAFSNPAPEKKDDIERFQQQLVRLFSLLYGCALTQVSQMQVNYFEVINLDGFDPESLKFLQTSHDKCEITLQWIQRLIVESEQKQLLKIAPPILSRVYNELGNGIVNLNNARKIKEFPIPFPLAQMIMVMLLFHAFFTPLICAATVETTTWAALITFVVSFCYWSVLYIALELEMPFGDDPNDLPLREMAVDMNESLRQMLSPQASVVPLFNQAAAKSLKGWSLDFDSDLSVTACTPTSLADTALVVKDVAEVMVVQDVPDFPEGKSPLSPPHIIAPSEAAGATRKAEQAYSSSPSTKAPNTRPAQEVKTSGGQPAQTILQPSGDPPQDGLIRPPGGPGPAGSAAAAPSSAQVSRLPPEPGPNASPNSNPVDSQTASYAAPSFQGTSSPQAIQGERRVVSGPNVPMDAS